MNLKTLLESRSSNGGGLLKGSDIPKQKNSVSIEVIGVREPPQKFTAYLILDIKPIFGKSGWAVNKTNLNRIIEGFGHDATKLVGKKIKLNVIEVRNPQTGQIVRSLEVAPEKNSRE